MAAGLSFIEQRPVRADDHTDSLVLGPLTDYQFVNWANKMSYNNLKNDAKKFSSLKCQVKIL